MRGRERERERVCVRESVEDGGEESTKKQRGHVAVCEKIGLCASRRLENFPNSEHDV
jgi:hypothetical protein